MAENKDKIFDVAIVGCGPVGAVLANLLGSLGHKVAIFERFKEVFYAPRAMGLDDASQRIFQSLGILEKMATEGHMKHTTAWFADSTGKELIEFSEPSIGKKLVTKKHGHSPMGVFDQPSCERILREEFNKNPTITAFWEYEVSSLSDDKNNATITAKKIDTEEEQTYTTQYIIGCDGANSMVRKAISEDFYNYKYNEQYLVVDAIVEDKVYLETMLPEGAIWFLDPKRSGVLAKGMHGHVRLDFLLGNDMKRENGDYADIVTELIEARGLDPQKFRVIRQAPYKFDAKSPKKWRKGRLMVAGDAAHLTPPWAAQGLNMGFRDTTNLAFKLDLILRGKAKDKLLDTYHIERIKPVLHIIKISVRTGKLMTAKNPIAIGYRNLVAALTRKSTFVRQLMFKDWQGKPPYNKGLIGSNHRLAGRVMIQLKVAKAKIEDINRPLHWLDDLIGFRFALISIGRGTGTAMYDFVTKLEGKILRYNADFIDPSGELLTWFKKHKVKHVLVRPDRYIFDAGNDSNALCQSLLSKLDNPIN